ncbi:hypothetical protein E4U36_004794 [Claviceps purpurea]|nr:hypothetical protein E4U36_004794 [Claviceps purpurea]
MRPKKESLSQHLKKFHADIYNLQCSTKWTNYGICQDKFDQRTATTTEINNFVVNIISSFSSVSTLRSLISYDGLFSNISTKTPSPRTLSAKKNGPPMPLKNLSMPLSIALPITPSTTTKQTPLMKILLTPRLNAQLRTLNPDKDSASFDDENSADFDGNDHV